MHCTNTVEGVPCEGTSFDLHTEVMFTLDAAGEPKDATATLDGFHKDPNDFTLTCRECGANATVTDQRYQAVVIALIRQEKRLSAELGDFSSYTFEDGTVITPDEITEPALRDVTAGTAYQAALKHHQQVQKWEEVQHARIAAGEIDAADLHVMGMPAMQATVRLHAALLAELAS